MTKYHLVSGIMECFEVLCQRSTQTR